MFSVPYNSHGKDSFPGAIGVKETKAVRNKVAEDKLHLLANFVGSDHVTRNVAAEYKNYMRGCFLELQQNRNRLYALYEDHLQTLFQKEREDLSKNHPLVSSDDDDNAISHGTSLSERKIHTSSEPSSCRLS